MGCDVPRRARRPRLALALLGVAGLLAAFAPRAALAQAEPDEPVLAVLPFQVHSAKPLDYLGESVANLIRSRLEASGQVRVLDAAHVSQRVGPDAAAGASEAQLRALARDLGSGFVVSGSLTELGGRYSLDVRVTSAAPAQPGHTLVVTADREDELLTRVNELADRVLGRGGRSGAVPGGRGGDRRRRSARERAAGPTPDARRRPLRPRRGSRRPGRAAERPGRRERQRRDRARPRRGDRALCGDHLRAHPRRAPRRRRGQAGRRGGGARQPAHRGRRHPRAHRHDARWPLPALADRQGRARDLRPGLLPQRPGPHRGEPRGGPHRGLRGRGEPGRAADLDLGQRQRRRREDPRHPHADHGVGAGLPPALREPGAGPGPLQGRGLLPRRGRLRDRDPLAGVGGHPLHRHREREVEAPRHPVRRQRGVLRPRASGGLPDQEVALLVLRDLLVRSLRNLLGAALPPGPALGGEEVHRRRLSPGRDLTARRHRQPEWPGRVRHHRPRVSSSGWGPSMWPATPRSTSTRCATSCG